MVLKKIYLATPYSDNDEKVMEERYLAVTEAVANFTNDSHVIFSPITHFHNVAKFMNTTTANDNNFWLRQVRPMLDWCEELWILKLPGWDKSVGVQYEIDVITTLNKPIKVIDPETYDITAYTSIPVGNLSDEYQKYIDAWTALDGVSGTLPGYNSSVYNTIKDKPTNKTELSEFIQYLNDMSATILAARVILDTQQKNLDNIIKNLDNLYN